MRASDDGCGRAQGPAPTMTIGTHSVIPAEAGIHDDMDVVITDT